MANTTKNKSSRVSPTNKPSLKSQGAKYSVTNRKGETTYYKSSKDAAGYSDTFEGKGSSSKGTPISRVDATGKVINTSTLGATPIEFPKMTPDTSLNGVMDMANAALGGTNFDTKTKQFVQNTGTATDNFAAINQAFQYANSQAFSDMPSQESMLKEQRKMLRPKEDLVNSLQGQINVISANRDQAVLSLEGQGRGQTEGFIGGEQARINREAAIQAMPIQAQLAIAQDDLESARSYASQLFQAKAADAQARYNYQKELNSNIFNFLNESEKRRLATKEREEDRAFQIEQGNRQTLKQLSMQAIEYGQGALAGEIMRLDPASNDFETSYADVVSRLRKPVAPRNRDTGFDKAGNLIDMQTGEIIRPSQYDSLSSSVQEAINQATPSSTKTVLSTLLGGDAIQAGTKGRIAPALAVLNSVDEFANSNVEGKFTGIGGFGRVKEGIKGIFNLKSPEATTNEQNIEAINLKVQQWASGASLTEAQTEQVNRFTPTKWDSDKSVRTKLNGLYNFMLNQAESDLLTDGVNIQFPSVNLFEIRDLYEKASPEQKKVIEQTYFNK